MLTGAQGHWRCYDGTCDEPRLPVLKPFHDYLTARGARAMSRLLGGWNINWDAFGAKFGPRNLDQLVLASPPSLPGLPFGTAVDDFSATIDESRQPCPPYLRVVPFGCREDAISPLIDDGDILVFVHQAVNRDNPAEALKQRGWHAEICYKNDAGQAFQKAPWGPTPRDKPCNDSDPSWIIHIFRLELPGIDRDRVVTLKRQVRSWKTIFNDYDFPTDGNPATGGHWFLDPADFASVSDLEDLARRIIRRPEGIKPSVPPVTCVQWAYQVLCLALNVPLSHSNLRRLAVEDDFSKSWQSQIPLADDRLLGINTLPFVPYSPAQVLQAFLDTYMPGKSLLALLRLPGAREFLHGVLEAQRHPGMPEAVESYLNDISSSGDISRPLVVHPYTYRFVMPIAFFCEARTPPSDTGAPWFRYVATALHTSVVTH
jgi:hypothetical protein